MEGESSRIDQQNEAKMDGINAVEVKDLGKENKEMRSLWTGLRKHLWELCISFLQWSLSEMTFQNRML